MRISLLSIPLLLAIALFAAAQGDMPWISAVEPPSGKVGDLITVQGSNLGPEHVAELYLTDGKADVKVKMEDQKPSSIKFRIPKIDPGRLALMVLTKGANPQLIQQPVKITVEQETTL